MKRLNLNETGMGLVIVLGLVVVVAVVGVVGARVLQKTDPSTASLSVPAQTKVPKNIKSSSDLSKASAALEATAVDSAATDQLDSDLNTLL